MLQATIASLVLLFLVVGCAPLNCDDKPAPATSSADAKLTTWTTLTDATTGDQYFRADGTCEAFGPMLVSVAGSSSVEILKGSAGIRYRRGDNSEVSCQMTAGTCDCRCETGFDVVPHMLRRADQINDGSVAASLFLGCRKLEFVPTPPEA